MILFLQNRTKFSMLIHNLVMKRDITIYASALGLLHISNVQNERQQNNRRDRSTFKLDGKPKL